MNTPPSVIAGSAIWRSPSIDHSGPPRPWNGSSSILKPTYWISINPNQKIGIDTPATEKAMTIRSVTRPRRTAATVPIRMPSGTAQIRLASISSTVGPTVLASSLTTVELLMIERPRSSCSTRKI